MRPIGEIADAMLESLQRAPLVQLKDGYFEFYLEEAMVYDFKPSDAGHALRWIEHMAQKSWITKEHLEQYARLAAGHFGAGYV